MQWLTRNPLSVSAVFAETVPDACQNVNVKYNQENCFNQLQVQFDLISGIQESDQFRETEHSNRLEHRYDLQMLSAIIILIYHEQQRQTIEWNS